MLKDPGSSVKKVRRGSRGKHQRSTSCGDERGTMRDSLTDGISNNKELTMLGTQLMAKLKVSPHLKPKLKCAELDQASQQESEKPTVSNSLKHRNQELLQIDGAQDDTMYFEQSASTSKDFLYHDLEKDNAKHNCIARGKKESIKEERKENGSMTVSTMSDFSETDVSSSNTSSIIKCENGAEDVTDITQEITLKCKTETKFKIKSKEFKEFSVSCLSELKVTGLNKDQHDIRDKTKKRCKENKIKIKEKSNKINTSEESPFNDKRVIDNVIKNIPNAHKTQLQKKKKEIFLDLIPVHEMKKILKNLQVSDNVLYVTGTLRVSSKYSNYAYLSMEDKQRDLLINGVVNRNRAFDGDLVVARINPEENWQTFANGQIQKTGTVISILKKIHPRKATGCLVQHARKDKPFVIIKPKDHRIPLIRIHTKSLPSSYHEQPKHYENMIFFVYINSWTQPNCALGELLSIVGNIGDINTELQALLLDNNLETSPYPEYLLQGLPDNDYVLTDTDMNDREDWRHECIFTIDPATAVDLDDALSCKALCNGNYEVGVHIADVTHYLEFFTPLDNLISKRATTIYLPHMSYHLLPKQLCQICSLLPGEDRLAFSVIWEMTPNAEIVKHRFAKTVIRSCCQMSYESAQIMIDNPISATSENIVNIKGDYTTSSLSDVVNNLFKLSVILQNRRFANGALRLDQPKIEICLDPMMIKKHEALIPVNYRLQERTDSNRLIEEFMLLANMTVAAQLYETIPETALLRVHNNPPKHNLITICEILQKYGIHLDTETAGTLYTSIQRYENSESNFSTDDNSMKYIMMVITNVCLRTMARAEYICASTVSSDCDLRHYALNAPLYTHFTSPIRRYSDCVVHRLLYATMINKSLPKRWTAKQCSKIAANCNIKKSSAKIVQEQSNELFFAYMVGLAGGFNALAIVLDVKEYGMDVILCDTGIRLRIHFKDIEETTATVEYSTEFSVPTIIINWKTPAPVTQKINMFSLVHVRVEKYNETFRLKALLQQ